MSLRIYNVIPRLNNPIRRVPIIRIASFHTSMINICYYFVYTIRTFELTYMLTRPCLCIQGYQD